MRALDDVGGEIPPRRRITADSFRLLQAKLKNRPVPVVKIEPLPEPVAPPPDEIIQETLISAAVEEAVPEVDQPAPTLAAEPVETIQETPDSAAVGEAMPEADRPAPALAAKPVEIPAKKPWAWLIPAAFRGTPAADPLADFDAPVEAAEATALAPDEEASEEIPFERLFADLDLPPPEPKLAQPEPVPAEPDPVLESLDAETPAPEPDIDFAEPELPPEMETAAPEPDIVFAEPDLPPPEMEEAAPEPDIVSAEPDLPLPEMEVTASEPDIVFIEPELPPEMETAAPEPEPVAAEPEPVPPEVAIATPAIEVASPQPETNAPETSAPAEAASPAATDEKPSIRRKSQLPNGKLGDDLLPTSGIVVHGISEVARAIYMTPTPTDRAEFLAEVAAMAAADAAWEKQRAILPSIIQAEIAPKPKPQLRKAKPIDDPFAKLDLDGPGENASPDTSDEDAGELARSLLDMMLSNPSAGQPQERALAADALLKLVPRIPLRSLVTVVDRLSLMEDPPHLLVSKLIHDPRIEVSGPLLENCNHISDQVLGKVIATGKVSLLRLIARRRHISATLSDQLVEFDDPSVILTLVRNNGAAFSHSAFPRLAEHAQRNHAALAPFATRADLPAPIAFELFWFVPAELRRYLLSRFLTDSETLTKILKITHAMGGGELGMETRFAEREQIEAFIELLGAGKFPEAAGLLAEIAGIQTDNAARIIADANGEPLTVALKAIGTNRARFGELMEILKASDFGIIASNRGVAELQNIFDSMSFNKARVLLTYWDWAVLKSGPYAPAN